LWRLAQHWTEDAKVGRQLGRTLKTYAAPPWDAPINQIDAELVLFWTRGASAGGATRRRSRLLPPGDPTTGEFQDGAVLAQFAEVDLDAPSA
jgi:hypothetical protein